VQCDHQQDHREEQFPALWAAKRHDHPPSTR
jgi:hypothetical protein